MTTSSRKFFAVIIERNGQELARDIFHIDGAADARRKLMQLVRQHEIDPLRGADQLQSRGTLSNKRGWAESMRDPRPPRSPAPHHETAIGIKTFRDKSARK